VTRVGPLLLVLALAACGVKGPPRPPVSKNPASDRPAPAPAATTPPTPGPETCR
jgi:predicted small lipoprotein YifL